jgi:hypothetical protein
MTTIDDQTALYILATRKAFDDLRQAISQLAGALVLASAGAKVESLNHEQTRKLYRQAVETLRDARLSTRAAVHHAQLLRAAEDLETALRRAGAPLNVDAVLPPLRSAYEALQKASQTLPGFEMVAFEQGCCSALQGLKI